MISFVGRRVTVVPAGTTVGGFIDLTKLALGSDTAAQAGDLVIVAYATGSTANRTLSIADYTLIDELYSDDANDTNLRIAYRFMPVVPETNVVLGPTGHAQDEGAAAALVFRGVDPITPFDVASVSATGINSRHANPPPIRPLTTGAWIVVAGAAAVLNGTAGYFATGLAPNIVVTRHGMHPVMLGVGFVEWDGSQVCNPAKFGGGSTFDNRASWAALTMALRPV